jgi:hypothetical protein
MPKQDIKKANPGSQMRISLIEIQLLKSVFKGNEELLRLMRKLFLPELDPYTPLGQNIDLWMTVKIDEMTPEQALINLKARNMLIQHLDMQLLMIKSLVENTDDTPEQALEKLRQNSSK